MSCKILLSLSFLNTFKKKLKCNKKYGLLSEAMISEFYNSIQPLIKSANSRSPSQFLQHSPDHNKTLNHDELLLKQALARTEKRKRLDIYPPLSVDLCQISSTFPLLDTAAANLRYIVSAKVTKKPDETINVIVPQNL